MTSWLDRFLSIWARQLRLFRRGWGDLGTVQELSRKPVFFGHQTKKIDIVWSSPKQISKDVALQEGTFKTPFDSSHLPFPVQTVHVQKIIPLNEKNPPICIHLAATGEEGFRRRKSKIAIPLAKQGIASIILESPFYGLRRPHDQNKFKLNHIVDLSYLVMMTIEEVKSLVAYLRSSGSDRLGISGFSMGGYLTALAGSQIQEPIALVPLYPPHSGSPAFLEGVLKDSLNLKSLQKELGGEDVKIFLKNLFDQGAVTNYPPPFCPEAAIIVAGKQDAFIPQYSPKIIHEHWKGAEIRWIDTGHASAFFFMNREIQKIIVEAFKRLEESLSRRP